MYVLSFDVGLKNLAFCLFDNSNNRILDWNVTEVPTSSISKLLVFLNECNFWNFDIDVVVIEKQPSKNVKMRIMENMLLVYFNMKHIKQVCSFSAKHKLGDLGKTVKGVKNYNLRKKMAVTMCTTFLEQNDTFRSFFEKHTKKDDLADSLLQALAYSKYDLVTIQTSIVTL